VANLSVSVPPDLERYLRQLALVDRRSLTDVVADALNLYLALPDAGRRAFHTVAGDGTAEDRRRLASQMSRTAARISYEVAARRALETSDYPSLAADTLAHQDNVDHAVESLLATTEPRAGAS
jgi:hypothetical protein